MASTSTSPGNRERLCRTVFPHDLDLSFADAAMAKGYLTLDRLDECRRDYERLRAEGREVSLGTLLLRRGDLTVDQYLEVLAGREAAATSPGPRDPQEAARFVLGKYRVVRELGRGGMGIVYEARDSVLQRRVALKVLKPQEPPSSTAIDRFRREATIAAKLQHPNIVRVQEFGVARDSLGREMHFLAMEYIEGKTLSRLIEEGTPQDDLLRILEDVGRAVACAHRMGVIHRDLKPSNVMVESTGRPVLADFGAAQAEDFETRLTTSGVVIGTPAYMAPEQVRGETGMIDARTDVYALGAMLVEVLTGRPPAREPLTLRVKRILADGPTTRHPRLEGVDPQLDLIVQKSLAPDPAERYPGAREWVQDLARFRRGEPLEVHRALRTSRRRRSLAVAGAILAFAAACFGMPRDRRADGPSAVELGRRAVETARLLGQRMDDVLGEGWRDEIDVRSDDRVRDLRARLTSDLEGFLARVGDGPEGSAARGVLAWMAGDADGARRLLAEAEARSLPGAGEILSMLEMDQRRYEAAIQGWTRSLERDPANPDAVRGCAVARFLRAVELSDRGESAAEEEFAAAAAGFDAGVPQDRRALVRSGVARLAWAFQRARHGREFDDLFAESIRRLDAAVAEGGEASTARLWRGVARTLWGMSATIPPWSRSAGRDPAALASAAIADFDAVIVGRDAPETAWMWRGAAFVLQGIVRTARLVDPTESYERALGDLGEAIRRNPSRAEAWMWRGIARRSWAIRELLGGRDPRAPVESAVDDLTEAIRRNPGRAESWAQRGQVRLLWAKQLMRTRGEDPFPVLEEAIRDLDESLRLDPLQAVVWSYRGTARETCGRLQAARREWYAAALGDYVEATRIHPALAGFLATSVDACVDVLCPR